MLVCLGGFLGYTLAYAGIYNHGQYATAPWNALRGTRGNSGGGGGSGSSSSSSSGGGGFWRNVLGGAASGAANFATGGVPLPFLP